MAVLRPFCSFSADTGSNLQKSVARAKFGMDSAMAQGPAANRMPPPPTAPKPPAQRPACSGRKLREVTCVTFETGQGPTLEDLSWNHKRRQQARERLHGPALAFSRQSSEDSNFMADLEFLFAGAGGSSSSD
ncbi:unnamed protein product [Durusdinium trenchii]|uniref:Uncharacterized protein n=1 Tax=Durusdinium trenchii TaxID=1381693 RepID=A0ABP0SW10_9DINO